MLPRKRDGFSYRGLQTPKIVAGGSKMDIVVLIAVGDKELVAMRNIPRRAEIYPALDLLRKRQRNADR